MQDGPFFSTRGEAPSGRKRKWIFQDLGMWADDTGFTPPVLVEDSAMAMVCRLLLERAEWIMHRGTPGLKWEESLQGAFWRLLAACGPVYKNAVWAAQLAQATDSIFDRGQDRILSEDTEAAAKLSEMVGS